ncbi:hypothetical protein IF1G_07947 [Cordyceps javanica]|uniref:Uncharacterized protein n=1 Tax=Cordyceps javanica TaxID=43265 RepID=A0A545UV78_9HYPO|nr:hypothetical protein IF1G_07947 [Cordyceps javanica]TQW05283.1 hypothetical protein IF2G_07220 [Cordyceps javanica]
MPAKQQNGATWSPQFLLDALLIETAWHMLGYLEDFTLRKSELGILRGNLTPQTLYVSGSEFGHWTQAPPATLGD